MEVPNGMPGRSMFRQTSQSSVTKVVPRPSSFVMIILVMIKATFLTMFGVDVCLDQTLLLLTIEASYRRHNRQHEFLCSARGMQDCCLPYAWLAKLPDKMSIYHW